MSSAKPRRRPIVEIEWVDSIFHSGWTGAEVMQKSVTDESMMHRTAGYLFKEDRRCVAVCQSSGDDTDSVDAVMQIPRTAVKTIRRLEK